MAKYKEKQLDITADDKIFTPRGVGALNIGVVQCLSELVANSLDWRRFTEAEIESIKQEIEEEPEQMKKFSNLYAKVLESGPAKSKIKIRFNGRSIEIWDNGIGMTLDDLEISLRLRAASDKLREPLRSRKGMFGMGMKVGILGMGWKFSIRTRSLIEGTENEISINTRKIENGTLKLKNIIGKVYQKFDESGPLAGYESGTYIKIETLHKKKHKPEIWRQELGRNFTPEIEYKDTEIIVINNSFEDQEEIEYEPCEPEIIDVIPEYKIKIDDLNLKVAPDFGDGTRGEPMKIKGWVSIRKVSGSGSGRWGLHTFRKGQLVEAFHNNGPKDNGLMPKNPHPTHARVHGEIHLDMCDPNFTKVGWNTELKSWTDVREALRPILEDMTKISIEYRVKSGGGAKSKQLIQSAKMKAKESLEKLDKQDTIELSGDEPLDSRDFITVDEGKTVKISIAQEANSNTDKFWDSVYNPESHELAIFVNTDSHLWQWAKGSKDPEKLTKLINDWAIVDSMLFFYVNNQNKDFNTAVNLRNQWHLKLYKKEEEE